MQKKKAILWGVGSFLDKAYTKICREYDIVAIVDADREKQGAIYNGYYVGCPKEVISRLNFDYVVVTSSYEAEICAELKVWGVESPRVIKYFSRSYFSSSRGIYHNTEFYCMTDDLEKYGTNVAIIVISHNRSSKALRLMSSVSEYMSGFEGEIVIFDNGSAISHASALRDGATQLQSSLHKAKVIMARSEVNLGVARGRNKASTLTEKKWIMFVDDDIYFIDEPWGPLQAAIHATGARFISFPLLNPDGNTLYSCASSLHVDISASTMFLGTVGVLPSGINKDLALEYLKQDGVILSSFLFGGAGLYCAKLFREMSGFDENYFIGFEDLDFSLRLYVSGVKVANVVSFFAVHDQIHSDRNYSLVRFSDKHILASAHYFKQKHGFQVYTEEVDKWLLNNAGIHSTE